MPRSPIRLHRAKTRRATDSALAMIAVARSASLTGVKRLQNSDQTTNKQLTKNTQISARAACAHVRARGKYFFTLQVNNLRRDFADFV
ncbi:MAG: hypothetical protein KF708_14565 [Pirellulales bacterium]|nr:hypothetical protein [Pirellulales bacterium]